MSISGEGTRSKRATFDSASEPLLNAPCRSERPGGLAGASRRAPGASHLLRAPLLPIQHRNRFYTVRAAPNGRADLPARVAARPVLRTCYGLPYFRFSIGTASIRSVPLRMAGRTCRRESPRARCFAPATGSRAYKKSGHPKVAAFVLQTAGEAGLRSPCRPCRPCRPCPERRRQPGRPSSAVRRPWLRWSAAGRRPKRRSAGPCG